MTPGIGELAVAWAPAENADGYVVEWKAASQGYDANRRAVLGAADTSYTIGGLTAGAPQPVRVTATRSGASADAPPSEEASGTPLRPTVSLSATPIQGRLILAHV